MVSHLFSQLQDDDVVLEKLPDAVESSLEVRKRFLASLPPDSGGLEFVVADLQRWMPGETVTVAFLGGDAALHRDIADATRPITDACNIFLDFGLDQATGAYRTWSEQDQDYKANIRVSFDKSGYWSLVGTDSVDASVGAPMDDVGGRPHQRSLNLGGFTVHRPANWKGVVRHEFLHALAFHHEHQNVRGPCSDEFRWDDDPGYLPTRDAAGRFVTDTQGRRPGIYTYLAGYPNFWDKAKIDFNLRTQEDPNTVAGPFDAKSVMLYQFPALFYRSSPSPCAPAGDGIELSDEDKRGLRLLYGSKPQDVAQFMARAQELAQAIESAYPALGQESVFESTGGETLSFAQTAMQRLERLLGG